MEDAILLLVYLGIVLVGIAGWWRAFEKAGQPGWAALIPLYDYYVMLKAADNPGWWTWLVFVPFVNLWALYRIHVDFARQFGYGILFGLGLWFFWFVFFPVLGLGNAEYRSGSEWGGEGLAENRATR